MLQGCQYGGGIEGVCMGGNQANHYVFLCCRAFVANIQHRTSETDG